MDKQTRILMLKAVYVEIDRTSHAIDAPTHAAGLHQAMRLALNESILELELDQEGPTFVNTSSTVTTGTLPSFICTSIKPLSDAPCKHKAWTKSARKAAAKRMKAYWVKRRAKGGKKAK